MSPVELVENLLGQQLYHLIEGVPRLLSTDVGFAHRISREPLHAAREDALDKVYISPRSGSSPQEHRPGNAVHRRHPQTRHGLRHRSGGDGEAYLAMAMAVSHLMDPPGGPADRAPRGPPWKQARKLGFCRATWWRKVNRT